MKASTFLLISTNLFAHYFFRFGLAILSSLIYYTLSIVGSSQTTSYGGRESCGERLVFSSTRSVKSHLLYLYEIIDFVRFRVVSRAWRSSTPLTDLPPQFPWISNDRRDMKDLDLKFFSMPSNKIYTIHVAKSRDKLLRNSWDGYYLADFYDNIDSLSLQDPILTFDSSKYISLLNPLNNDEVLLPKGDYDVTWLFWPGVNQIGEYVVSCATFCNNSKGITFAFCPLGQEYWCELKLPDSDFDRYGLYFYNDLLFAVENETGVTKVTNITSGSLVYVVPPVEDYLTFGGTSGNRSHKFEVVESSGVILGIFVSEYSNGKLLNLVHRLVINNSGIPRWSKTENIGNYAIFMDLDSVCFMLEANDLAGIKANCIYALKQKYVRLYDVYLNEIERLDIETGAREHVRCPFQNGVSWYVPRLHHLRT